MFGDSTEGLEREFGLGNGRNRDLGILKQKIEKANVQQLAGSSNAIGGSKSPKQSICDYEVLV